MKIALLIAQIISCVALIVIVMLQTGKDEGLGALAGNTENYFGKNKAATRDAKLARATKWVAAVFVLLTLLASLFYTAA